MALFAMVLLYRVEGRRWMGIAALVTEYSVSSLYILQVGRLVFSIIELLLLAALFAASISRSPWAQQTVLQPYLLLSIHMYCICLLLLRPDPETSDISASYYMTGVVS